MNLIADESVDAPIVQCLRDDGHLVIAIAEVSPSLPDDAVLDMAVRQQAVLLTGDKDFGELVYRLHRVHFGIVLLRLSGLSRDEKLTIVSEAFRLHGDEFSTAFTVITPNSIRLRKDEPTE